VIELRLTLDQVTFIISGLRDCADAAVRRFQLCTNREELDEEQKIVDENRALANELEATYVQQLKG
jgi:hypothetical protein